MTNYRDHHWHRRHRRRRGLAALEQHQRDLEEELADTVDAIRRWREDPPRPRRRRDRTVG
jgi:hypothetical protein